MKRKISLLATLVLLLSFCLPAFKAAAASNLTDGQYTLNVNILKDGTNESSVMNQYINKSTLLIVENGQQYVQLSIKNDVGEIEFKVEENGKLVNVKTISETSQYKVVQFKVGDLTKKLNAWVKISIPKISYFHDYNVQLTFDPKSIKPYILLTVSNVSDKSTKVTGTTSPGTQVQLYLGGKLSQTKTANAKTGKYTFTIKKQKAGVKVKVVVTNSANKKVSKTITVTDKTPPAKPKVNKVTTKSTTVTGTAEANATVYVYKGKTKLGSVKAKSNGKFSVKIKKQKKNTTLTIYATDKAKNKSKNTTTKVK